MTNTIAKTICEAAAAGDLAGVLTALERGDTANDRGWLRLTQWNDCAWNDDHDYETALFCAARYGHVETCALLLDRGAEVNALSGNGQTALMGAGDCGKTKVMALLLDRGADVNALSGNGQTALMYAAMLGNPETARMLLAAGADPAAQNKDGETALMFADSYDHTETAAVLRAHVSALKLAEAIRGATVLKQAPEQSRRL